MSEETRQGARQGRQAAVRRAALVVLLAAGALLVLLLLQSRPGATRAAPVLDGRVTGDWCAPDYAGVLGPDTFSTMTSVTMSSIAMGGQRCPLGDEFLWDDWDAENDPGGLADTMGWTVGGTAGEPLSDPAVDIDYWATRADWDAFYFLIVLGPYDTGDGSPPHLQIAIDLYGLEGGNPFWYDPAGAGGTGGLGLDAGIAPDYLITTDVMAGEAFAWEATSVPGEWTSMGPPGTLAWSGPAPDAPGVIEIAVPWSLFHAQSPPLHLGFPAHISVMSAHSRPFLADADAPLTPEDDVITEAGLGFSVSPDICAPGPQSADCELHAGGGSADGFVLLSYPMSDAPTAAPTPTATPMPTTTPHYQQMPVIRNDP